MIDAHGLGSSWIALSLYGQQVTILDILNLSHIKHIESGFKYVFVKT